MNEQGILNKVNNYENGAKILTVFTALAGRNLSDCKDVGAKCLERLNLKGISEEMTLTYLVDAYIIATKSGDNVLTENGVFLGKMMGCPELVVSEKALELFGNDIEDIEIVSHKEKDTNALDREEGTTESDSEEDTEKEKIDEDESKIMSYYAAYYNGVVQELLKRYSSMFSSGYQLKRPAGILTNDGIVRLSGSERIVGEDSVSTYNIYQIIKSNIDFIEYQNRSIRDIANDIYNEYSSSGRLIYFPNKMLEFAFGVEAPKTDGVNSLKSYNKHSNANSWSMYVSSELEGSVRRLVGKATYGFVIMEMRNNGISDYRDKSIGENLKGYLDYVRSCLSFCILFPEYKVAKTSNGPEVTSFKIRICDPTSGLLGKDLTPVILKEGFMGSAGKDAFSYPPDINTESYVVEYSHEFNHAMSQATPLFAYKALESILNNGEQLSWDKMILGMSSNGSILRSIPADSTEKGIKLGLNLTHNITAGSRAGKGVMTLSILASGVASNKNVFYLDRKPDMASLFKYMSPSMFVINGADYQAQYDTYQQWAPDVTNKLVVNVPDEVLQAFDITPSWANLGDLAYMRALKLVIGIIMLRGSFDTPSESLGGKEGILCVIDEFTNFQASYMKLISKLTNYIPNIKIDDARQKLEEGKITQAAFDRAYNNRNYYALSYMLSAMKDVEYVDNKKRAGFNPMEVSYSDVFVIGQDIKYGEFNYSEFKDSFQQSSSSARKKSTDGTSLNASGFQTGTQSIPYSLVNFKTADAFFGRNDQGYLAAGNSSSKAHGKLDDKASNFAYMSNFSETVRERMVADKGLDNLNYAEQCKYFKPFLILNSSGLEDQCVAGMFARVETNAGVSREELTAENPSYNDPSRINEAIGFIDYINMAGCNNVNGVLAKSSNIANYVVQQVLKYPGDWLQFITDFSPEWLFTIEDIVLAGTEGDCPLWHPESNPVLKEYYDFNPERFGGSFVDPSVKSERSMDEFMKEDSTKEDFSNTETMDAEEIDRFKDVFGEFEKLDIHSEDEIDIFGSLVEEELNNTSAKDIGVTSTQGGEFEATVREAEALINRLEELGVNVSISENSTRGVNQEEEPLQRVNNRTVLSFDSSSKFEDTQETYEMLLSTVTNNIVSEFGGLHRFKTFRVKGGSIGVNGYFYRCKVSTSSYSNIPYDIRRQLNSGNIQSLFDYSLLWQMPNLRVLGVDSMYFFQEYIQPLYKGKIENIFRTIPSLEVLVIGTDKVTRADLEQARLNEKMAEAARRKQIGDTIQGACFKGVAKSWGFNGRVIRSNKKWYVKALGLAAGTTGTVLSGAAGVTTFSARKLGNFGKNLVNGIKDLINT